MPFWQSKRGDLHLGLMRVWYTLFAICDKWPWGELSSTCALYETEKMRTAPLNQLAAILQASIPHHDLVVSMSPSRYQHCHLQLIGAHGTRPHPFQYFARLHEVAIADALANDSATKIPHSKYCTVTKVQITAPVSIGDLLRGDATNWFMNVIEWLFEPKHLEIN
jgi:hypothetical protein